MGAKSTTWQPLPTARKVARECSRKPSHPQPAPNRSIPILNPSNRAQIAVTPDAAPASAAVEDGRCENANDTGCELTAAAWTRDVGTARRHAKPSRTGTVWIDCQVKKGQSIPLGRSKQSGLRPEPERRFLEDYSNNKSDYAETKAQI